MCHQKEEGEKKQPKPVGMRHWLWSFRYSPLARRSFSTPEDRRGCLGKKNVILRNREGVETSQKLVGRTVCPPGWEGPSALGQVPCCPPLQPKSLVSSPGYQRDGHLHRFWFSLSMRHTDVPGGCELPFLVSHLLCNVTGAQRAGGWQLPARHRATDALAGACSLPAARPRSARACLGSTGLCSPPESQLQPTSLALVPQQGMGKAFNQHVAALAPEHLPTPFSSL